MDNCNLQIFIVGVFHGVSINTLHVPQRTSLHPELFPALFYLPIIQGQTIKLLNVTDAVTTTNNNSRKTRKLSTES